MSVSGWLPASLRSSGKERKLQAGQSLFRQGDRTAGLYEVMRGKVRLVRVDPSGREVVLHTAAAGDVIAEASLFSPAYHCDALAVTSAVVRLYPKAGLLAEFERDSKAARAFMAMLAREIMSLRTRLEQRNIHSARERVRHYLAVNMAPDGTVELPGTVKALAADLGLSHEALYRTLAEMEQDGEIERSRRRIRVARR